MSGNSDPKFPMLAYNFYFGINCTYRKLFEFVSGNLDGNALRTIQKRESLNGSRSEPFIYYSKQMVKEFIVWFIKERINGVQVPNYFSAGFSATKLVKDVRLSKQNQAIVSGAYLDHFCCSLCPTTHRAEFHLAIAIQCLRADDNLRRPPDMANP